MGRSDRISWWIWGIPRWLTFGSTTSGWQLELCMLLRQRLQLVSPIHKAKQEQIHSSKVRWQCHRISTMAYLNIIEHCYSSILPVAPCIWQKTPREVSRRWEIITSPDQKISFILVPSPFTKVPLHLYVMLVTLRLLYIAGKRCNSLIIDCYSEVLIISIFYCTYIYIYIYTFFLYTSYIPTLQHIILDVWFFRPGTVFSSVIWCRPLKRRLMTCPWWKGRMEGSEKIVVSLLIMVNHGYYMVNDG